MLLEDQKGFRVAPVSESELRELVIARCWIDGAAITESIREFDVAWEEALVLSLHRLSRVSRWAAADTATPDPAWEQLHREFHRTLVAGMWIALDPAHFRTVFDAAERYRLLAAQHIPERNELDEHKAIVDACLARDAAKAVKLLEAHYGKTFSVIMDSPNAPEQ